MSYLPLCYNVFFGRFILTHLYSTSNKWYVRMLMFVWTNDMREFEKRLSMETYTGFAEVYDLFMDNVPYEEWCSYLKGLLVENGVQDGLVLDLGCGTGNVTEILSKNGYDMIGIDNSEEMLSIAMKKNIDEKVLYLLQDMREFELYGTIKAAVSICDSMNYILEEEDLKQVFRLVNNYLDRNGVFIFDLNTEYKYKTILGEKTIAENREESSFIWENYYYEDEQVNEYQLTIFVKEKEQDMYQKFQETHYQRAYSVKTIKRLIEEAGMEFVTAYDAFTKEPPREDSERIYIVAREKWQENKLYV